MKETRKNRRWGTALRRAAAFFMCAVCLLGGTGTSHAEEKPLRILLIGVDAYEDQARGRSDTMVLVQADPAAGSVRALSFLRDLYVSIPGCGTTRLNAAYSFGGESLLKTALKNNFGVEVDRTVTVSFDSLCRIVDALGGIELEVTEEEREQLNAILAAYNRGLGLNPGDGRLSGSGTVHLTARQRLPAGEAAAEGAAGHAGKRQTDELLHNGPAGVDLPAGSPYRSDFGRSERPAAAGRRRRGDEYLHGPGAL